MSKPSHGAPCCAVGRSRVAADGTCVPRQSAAVVPGPCREADAASFAHIARCTFLMGTDDAEGFREDGEGPIREVELSAFDIGKTTVSNREFALFVTATGYRTDAEKYGWSFVFAGLLDEKKRRESMGVVQGAPWWHAVRGANWAHPEGPGSGLTERLDHPVVHVSWNDAAAYCHWHRARLPTEAEWECAARGGLQGRRFAWGDELTPHGKHLCNIWQGTFPDLNTAEDGYYGTAPSRSFEPNGYGLYNVCGNVWEWCDDWFGVRKTPGPGQLDPAGPTEGTRRVMRGGSFLCHESYCNRYRVAARTSNTPDSSASHIGFRCVVDVRPEDALPADRNAGNA